VIPDRVNWDSLTVSEGIIAPSTYGSMKSQPLSVIIDCAPFEQGINADQKAVINELPILNFEQLKPQLWKATRNEDLCRGRLALAGAAFRPKTEWGVQLMHSQAREIISEFFGADTPKT